MDITDDFFGDPVYRITRAQLIDDGVLVDVDTLHDGLPARCGVRVPCAMSATAYALAVWPNDPNEERFTQLMNAGENHDSRMRRVLVGYVRSAIRQSAKLRGESILLFAVTVQHAPNDWREIDLKAIVSTGDTGEMVLTILLPNED